MQPPIFAPKQSRPGLWRRTPPALFTPVFGLFGLGIAWRRATEIFQAPAGFGETVLGAVSLLYLFVLLAYLAKVARRVSVVPEDLRVLPGRAGLAALSLSGMLLALALAPYAPVWAEVVLALAVAIHAGLALLVAYTLLTGPAEGRAVTPVWHLIFVGFIVSALPALPLGWTLYATVVFWGTLAMAVAIWGASLAQFLRREVPAPLRPLLAIHLAPASLLGSVAMMVNQPMIGLVMGFFAIALLVALLARPRWLLEAGFTPLWGAFTFPLAAFSSLMQILAGAGYGEVFRILGGVTLIAATLIIPVIMWKVIQLWSKGMLAVKTNAAEA